METTNENTKPVVSISQPPEPHDDPRRDAVNDFVFKNYARDWAQKDGFFPVFQSLHDGDLIVNLYVYESSRDKRQLEEYILDFYRTVFTDFWFSWGVVIYYPYKVKPSNRSIAHTKSMQALEKLFFKVPENCKRTGYAKTCSSRIPNSFYYWTELIEDGYLTAEYERRCRKEFADGTFFASRRKTKLFFVKRKYELVKDQNGTYSVQVYNDYEGNQPEVMDVKMINQYFYDDYGKENLARNGVIGIFESYEDSHITFKMFSEPRAIKPNSSRDDPNFNLARYIATAFSENIRVLEGIVSFTAYHYKTTGKLVVKESKKGYPLQILSQDDDGKLTRVKTKANFHAEHRGKWFGRFGYSLFLPLK
jgi:hypothetical protein